MLFCSSVTSCMSLDACTCEMLSDRGRAFATGNATSRVNSDDGCRVFGRCTGFSRWGCPGCAPLPCVPGVEDRSARCCQLLLPAAAAAGVAVGCAPYDIFFHISFWRRCWLLLSAFLGILSLDTSVGRVGDLCSMGLSTRCCCCDLSFAAFRRALMSVWSLVTMSMVVCCTWLFRAMPFCCKCTAPA